MTLTHKTGRMNRKRHSNHDWLLYCGMFQIATLHFSAATFAAALSHQAGYAVLLGLCWLLSSLISVYSFRIWKRSNR